VLGFMVKVGHRLRVMVSVFDSYLMIDGHPY